MGLQELASARYVSLTTFRKDGTPVATPVWAVADGGELYVWTRTDSWKVKRIRNEGRVTLAACDVRGRVEEGAPVVEGRARLLDEEGLRRVRKLMSRKYTWQFWVVDVPAALARRGKRPHTAIAVKL
ncbi:MULTISPECIES: PPOX class F420-dependent oxidoreductase [Streptomyces]|uniref:PPOX class F420-dependent oxidoreductase n=1 Tax=Streptomyces TaxID=1883 RepID=UPI0004BDB9FC|nr:MULTISPECIES: PPOX class F420-dependent oxidoreductase [Streptomyces]KJY16737.1 pyridoxamine 5'-phosphate oxidase [Streptomyces sp. NRRL S-104]KOU29589.1 pyridoxamine 5'-phosphate oxidase [Streptomyces sp. WM6373]KOU67816.1 pyridoxamine 5'-phosphate oxidase [Streptomyces sp. IGB124]KOU70160.1 pyridoxamine 5'-phosphate oxidase [Streptomyces sp. XY66]KOU88723.1 pyridoxamine 5'-phosphate oxidase [Streptomyces sp. XY58]